MLGTHKGAFRRFADRHLECSFSHVSREILPLDMVYRLKFRVAVGRLVLVFTCEVVNHPLSMSAFWDWFPIKWQCRGLERLSSLEVMLALQVWLQQSLNQWRQGVQRKEQGPKCLTLGQYAPLKNRPSAAPPSTLPRRRGTQVFLRGDLRERPDYCAKPSFEVGSRTRVESFEGLAATCFRLPRSCRRCGANSTIALGPAGAPTQRYAQIGGASVPVPGFPVSVRHYCNRSAPADLASLRSKVSNFLAPSDLAW